MKDMNVQCRKTTVRYSVFTIVFLCIGINAWAQLGQAGIVNQSDGIAYVLSLPADAQRYEELLQNPVLIKDLLRQNADQLRIVPVGGIDHSLSVYRQDSAVLGYVHMAGELEHPLFLMKISSDASGRFFSLSSRQFLLDSTGEPIVYSAVEEQLPGLRSHQVDGRMVEWLQSPDALAYPAGYTPVRIRQLGSDSEAEISLGQSVFWKSSGTGLDRLRLAVDQGMLYGLAVSYQEIRDGLSLLFYYYDQRRADQRNSCSIEIPIAGTTGHVLLWEDDNQTAVIGNYHRGEYFIEFSIPLELLPSSIQQSFQGLEYGSFDVSTAFSDGQIYEEFLFGNLPLSARFSQ